MCEKIILEKAYTRDNCFIIQEVWNRAYEYDHFGTKNPFFIKVDYLTNGVIEFWDNKKAIQWFVDKLLEKNQKDDKFIHKIIKKHNKIVKELKKVRKKKHLNSTDELKKLINLMERGTYTFLPFWHSAMDERTPEDIKKKAVKIRELDTFYDDFDRLIKGTIEYLYPHTKGLCISILTNEIDSPPDKSILEQRFKNCVMITDELLEIKTLKEFAKENPKYQFILPKIPKVNYLKGQTAAKGQAIGRVKIIKLKSEASKVLSGEILISPMTTPDFVPAMKRAGAIITDEGGITCHAAIISRELNKPCIIGTKVATSFFKDGDLVEVDADKGIIKKIS